MAKPPVLTEEEEKTARDRIWAEAHVTYYDSFFNELVEECLLKRWESFDSITKLLIAVTTSSSAVAGWAAWKEPEFAMIWAGLTGVAALLSIVSAVLEASRRVREHTQSVRSFGSLRIKLETFLGQMRIFKKFAVNDYNDELLEYRKLYLTAESNTHSDHFETRHILQQVQSDLNARL